MSSETRPVTVTILDKEYLVACEESEREQLLSAAHTLNQKMQEVRNSGKVIGTERIAVMAALNLAHELVDYKSRNEDYTSGIENDIQRLRLKIEQVLDKSTA